MAKLYDITTLFKSSRVDWTLRGKAFAKQFEGRINTIRGVYAHVDANVSPLPIYDKNGAGKVIVFGDTTALKFGKFIGGVPARMLQNYDHFHRRPTTGTREAGIFPRVLKSFFVLDLSHRRADKIKRLETKWNRSVRTELKARRLIHPEHRGRSESINLVRSITKSELLAILQPIANRIDP